METESTKQRLVHKIGERAGIGIIVVLAIVFLSFQGTEQARSQEKEEFVEAESETIVEQNISYEYQNFPLVSESSPTPTQEDTENIAPTVQPTPTPTQTPQKKTDPTPTTAPSPTPTPLPVTPTPTPTPEPQVAAATVDTTGDAVWDQLAACEAGGNWATDTGNGYFGGLQFSQGAWESVGGSGNPAHTSREEQIMRGKMLRDRRGSFSAWGTCASRLGLN